MKRFWNGMLAFLIPLFFLMPVSLALVSCASSKAGAPVDPIVGKWDGVGLGVSYRAVFNKDHTFHLIDSDEDFAAGTWTARDGKYALATGNYQRTGTLDDQGELIITADMDPGIKLVFRRHGAPATATAGKPPAGEWSYAYTKKSSVPANCPPPFDVMTFMDQGKVRLKSSTAAKEFTVDYTLAGDVISIATGGSAVPKFDFRYRWEDAGKTLLLSVPQMQNGPFEFEWAFLKPDRFLPNHLEGTWVGDVPAEGMKEEVQLEAGGRFSRTVLTKDGQVAHKNNEKANDYYRLWKAPFGNALTVVTLNPEMGAQLTQLFRYEKIHDALIVTPIELTQDGTFKPHPEAAFTWKLKQKP